MTSDPVILSWVEGYKIPFTSTPTQITTPRERILSPREKDIMSGLIAELIQKGAIEECSPTSGQFISNIFFVPKPNKTHRFILNLTDLNKFIETPHFKLEDYKTASRLIHRNCFMSTLDLKDAYYLVSVHKSHRKYLRFLFNGSLYEFICIPFGLSSAPYTFTKLMKPIIFLLRRSGLQSVLYLDDFLLIALSKKQCSINVTSTCTLLTNLGFLINFEKSKLDPSRICKFLGFLFNSVAMTIELPKEKRDQVGSMIERFSHTSQCKIREFAQFVGTIVACCPAIKYSWMYTKELERQKFLALERSHENYEAKMSIRIDARIFNWWKFAVYNSHNSIDLPEFIVEIFSDASLKGWGAVCGKETANGR